MTVPWEDNIDDAHERKLTKYAELRHGSLIRLQLCAASPTNRPQPKVKIKIVIIKLKLWPAAGCEAKVVAELSSHPLGLNVVTEVGQLPAVPLKLAVEVSLHSLSRGGYDSSRIWQERDQVNHQGSVRSRRKDLHGCGPSTS